MLVCLDVPFVKSGTFHFSLGICTARCPTNFSLSCQRQEDPVSFFIGHWTFDICHFVRNGFRQSFQFVALINLLRIILEAI